MCKAMASDGTGSIVRDTDLGLADSAGPPTLPSSSSSKLGQPSFTRPLSDFQQHGPSAFEVCGPSVSAVDTTQLQQLTSMGPPVTATLSGPTASSQSTELFFMQSSTSSALSGYSTAAALQEAMQHMRLQSAPQQPASSSRPAAVAPTTTGQLLGRIGSTASQDSGDLAGLIGQAQQQMQQQEQTEEDGPATLFFAKVPRSATKERIQDLFARFGEVVSLNLFTPYENSPSSKGCGLVVMRSYSDAASAIVGLDNYRWEGMHSAMVVKLMAPQRQRQEQLSTATSGGSSSSYRSPGQASSSRMAQMASPVTRSSYAPASQMRMVLGVDVAPPGCAPNAYKLFVGNIPRAYTEPDLLPIFESIGPVRELVVLRDRATQESKGSAFIWYATGEDADKAQATFNMQLVLQTRAGSSSRPLVVRRAAPSKQGQPMVGMPGGTVSVAGYPQAQMQQAYAVAVPQGSMLAGNPMGYATVPVTSAQSSYSLNPGIPASAAMPSPRMYVDARSVPVAVMPSGSYMQQQVQQQQLWQQPQPQQGVSSVVHCQAQQAAQYAASVLLPISEAPPAGYTQVLQVQPGSWQPQQQQQATYMAGYDISQVPGAAGADIVQQQQGWGAAVMMSSVPQAIPAAQQMPVGGILQQQQQQPGRVLAAGGVSPAGNVLLGGSAGSSASSSAGPIASYQQFGNQQQLIIPLSADQLGMINSQLPNVMAMSGTSITAEHNYACGSLALNVIAASQQQANVAWQIIQGLLGQQGGQAAQLAEGML